MNENVPTVEPIDIPKYQFKNSKYEMMPSLPARMLAVASSTGGKKGFDTELNIEDLPQ